jgi:hypothetical protein
MSKLFNESIINKKFALIKYTWGIIIYQIRSFHIDTFYIRISQKITSEERIVHDKRFQKIT